jgi:hypothetical protein
MVKDLKKVDLNGLTVYYHCVLELLQEIIENDQNLLWKYDYNNGNIHYPNNTLGWKEYEDHFQQSHPKGRLLLPRLFIDEYNSEKSRKTKTLGIYLSCANQKINVKVFLLFLTFSGPSLSLFSTFRN